MFTSIRMRWPPGAATSGVSHSLPCCTKKITQDVRDYAARLGLDEGAAIEEGLRDKSQEFRRSGAELYLHEKG